MQGSHGQALSCAGAEQVVCCAGCMPAGVLSVTLSGNGRLWRRADMGRRHYALGLGCCRQSGLL